MEPGYRILGIDPGTRRVGLALSDDMHWSARALSVLKRSRSLEEDMAALRRVVEAHEVGEIVCGMPYRLDGSESDSTDRARVFFEAVRSAFPKLPVRERDEALTSWEAEEQMRAEGLSPKERRAQVDAYAARVLLQEELDERAGGHREDRLWRVDPGLGSAEDRQLLAEDPAAYPRKGDEREQQPEREREELAV